MKSVYASRTKRARATKAFEEVRVGSVRLYFSHFELIGFQQDGVTPVVCEPWHLGSTASSDHIRANRLQLEPDPTKWLPRIEFERAWEHVGTTAFRP